MLSVVITAWNEAKNLPRVVASVKPIASEIIVVDTESADDTISVAKKLGCTVYRHKNMGIVEPVRNFSISKAKSPWILVLDADEEIPHSLSDIIKQIISDDKYDYVLLPRKNIIFNNWVRTDHWWPDYVYRLFKKGKVTWKNGIHSVPKTEGVFLQLDPNEENSIIHHHYESVSQYIDRLNRYTDIQSKQMFEKGEVFKWQYLIQKPIDEFLNQYFSRKAYTQGVLGLSLSLLQAFSELTLSLKLWQYEKFNNSQIQAEDLNREISKKSREYIWWQYQSKIESKKGFYRQYLKMLRKIKYG